jgi:hypothetical protein
MASILLAQPVLSPIKYIDTDRQFTNVNGLQRKFKLLDDLAINSPDGLGLPWSEIQILISQQIQSLETILENEPAE